MELMILDWLQSLRTPAGDVIMPLITTLGNAGMIWILLTVLLLLFPKTRKSGSVLAAALCVDLVLCNGILKPLIGRIRPCDVNPSVSLLIVRPDDFSFPSGHTAASFAAVSALFLAGEKRLGRLALPLAVLIAFSRLYLYVHYPTDILGGVLVGLLSGYLGDRLIKRLKPGVQALKAKLLPSGKRTFRLRILFLLVTLAIVFLLWNLVWKRYFIPHAERMVPEESASLSQQTPDQSPSVPSVNIRRETIGAGKEKITYFTAELTLRDATDLKAALAKNQYGLNIRDTISNMATEHGAVFAFNGDYYGNRTDGMVIRDGVLYRDTSGGRECLVLYRDGTAGVVQEDETTGQTLLDAGAWNAFSFGPVLVENGMLRDRLDEPYKVDEMSLSITDRNPRTGIGVLGRNHFLVILADGRREGYSRGMTLQEFAQLFVDYGCELAYNLDGGSSVTLYQDGRILNRPCTDSGAEREISDMIYIKEGEMTLCQQ